MIEISSMIAPYVVSDSVVCKQNVHFFLPNPIRFSSLGWFDLPDEKNCNVYISGLPFDITDEEFEELMSKYGVISPDPNNPRKKKMKLYRDEQGNLKGDGTCRYLRVSCTFSSVKECILFFFSPNP